jgi:nicotinate-nucleotide adenylyltransferase
LAKLGIYGGTFDPIHRGHLHLIEQVLARKVVDRIILIPAGQPQLRSSEAQATGQQRREMCLAALKDLPPSVSQLVEVNPIEILRSGPSYTIDTVEAIKQTYPDDQLFLLLGTDAYQKIDEWHRSKDLSDLVEFVVIDRPDFPGRPTLDIDALNISATSVRSGDFSALSPSVSAYIKEHNLYASK